LRYEEFKDDEPDKTDPPRQQDAQEFIAKLFADLEAVYLDQNCVVALINRTVQETNTRAGKDPLILVEAMPLNLSEEALIMASFANAKYYFGIFFSLLSLISSK
jgi:hypothetical protein